MSNPPDETKAPAPARSEPVLADIDGARITLANQAQAITAIIAAARAGETFSVFTLNLDHLVKRRQSEAFRAAYDRARFITADGAPVVALARRQGADITRATGADLVLPLARAAAQAGLPIYLFGSSEASLDGAAQVLRAHAPGLVIAGQCAPAMGFDPTSPHAQALAAEIARSGARLCLVALGAPKQELFAITAEAAGPGVGYLGIGAALDFLSGHQIRAPKLFQKTGLEWAWRLGQNPRRMAKRYALCAMVLADIAWSERTRTSKAPSTI